MADAKISALTGASTPLIGTEVLPIVQSGTTVKVATNDLTVRNIRANATTGILQVTGPANASTRVVTVPDANFTAARTDAAQSFTGDQTLSTGNLVIGTSGKGIDFSATPGTGTSELLSDYEEGTWTPVFTDSGGGTYTYGSQVGKYIKIGKLVYVEAAIELTANSGNGDISIASLPFTVSGAGQAFTANYGRISLDALYTTLGGQFINATATLRLQEVGSGSVLNTGFISHTQLQSNAYIVISGTYITS